MNKFKNLIILTLTALLGLSLIIEPEQSAPASKTATAIQYEQCFQWYIGLLPFYGSQRPELLDVNAFCKKYKP